MELSWSADREGKEQNESKYGKLEGVAVFRGFILASNCVYHPL